MNISDSLVRDWTGWTPTEIISDIQSLVKEYKSWSAISLEMVSSWWNTSSQINIEWNKLIARITTDINMDQAHTFRLKITEPNNNEVYSNIFTITVFDGI